MADHNFIPKQDMRNTPTKQVWRCNNCDSEVIFPRGRNKTFVNKEMAIRLPCLPPDFFKS